MGTGGWRIGAGRPAWHFKAEHCKSLDIRRWQREGLLQDGRFGGWRWTDRESGEETGSIGYQVRADSGVMYVTLDYSVAGRQINDCIRIERTTCNYGGSRPWFQCTRCYGRAAKLFLRGGRFACRKCHRLVYASQSQDAIGRSWLRQYRLEARLGDDWSRPRGMHYRTYDRLLERLLGCEEQRDGAIAAFLGRLMERHPSLRDDPLFKNGR